MTCPKITDSFLLSARAGRIFIEFMDIIAGIHSPVISDGDLRLPAAKFVKLLNTYKRTKYLTIESAPNCLKLENFRLIYEVVQGSEKSD